MKPKIFEQKVWLCATRWGPARGQDKVISVLHESNGGLRGVISELSLTLRLVAAWLCSTSGKAASGAVYRRFSFIIHRCCVRRIVLYDLSRVHFNGKRKHDRAKCAY